MQLDEIVSSLIKQEPDNPPHSPIHADEVQIIDKSKDWITVGGKSNSLKRNSNTLTPPERVTSGVKLPRHDGLQPHGLDIQFQLYAVVV